MKTRSSLRVAMLAPISWRTPPREYGPWELATSVLTEGLAARGVDVTLFATLDSVTRAKLRGVAPHGYSEPPLLDAKVYECLHIANVYEHAGEFDIIHNHFDFLPLTYSRLVATPTVTTIHGITPSTLPVFHQYNDHAFYVSISNAHRIPGLQYSATVYHGIDMRLFTFQSEPGAYLLYFARMHPEKGAKEAIAVAKRTGLPLIMAGPVHDEVYFEQEVLPHVDGTSVLYVGNAGPEERNRLLGGARALLHLISVEEPFGLSVPEAMACGTPVIAFRRGSMAELIEHGTTGFVADTLDEAVAAVGKLSTVHRQACRERVEKNFTAENMVDGYLEVYERILQQPQKKTHAH
ncbi:MAG: group 1 glycosyl transferase [Parcubacteria group bacterium Gr01-1014_106]|nr:MAG: group 1 glycosyl transferase [Parcubacteria group bacterium Gr01-1014_106]